MFYIGEEGVDDEILALRPMTCPLQFTIYKNGLKSYRDLPVRYAETATLFRKEASGEMHGLTRVRQFTLSDGHIVCTPDQLEKEFEALHFRDDFKIKMSIGMALFDGKASVEELMARADQFLYDEKRRRKSE